MNPSEIIKVFKTGIKTRDNPNGLIKMHKFITDVFGNKKTKLCPIGEYQTRWVYGSFENPLYLCMEKNMYVRRGDRDVNLDDHNHNDVMHGIFKIRRYPGSSKFFNPTACKVIESCLCEEECMRKAMIWNTEQKIRRIKELNDEHTFWYQKDLEEHEFKTVDDRKYFFEKFSIVILKEIINSLKLDKMSLGLGVYIRRIVKGFDYITKQTFPFVKITALLRHENYKLCKIFKIMNPKCKTKDQADIRQVKLEGRESIEKLFDKPFRGWIEGTNSLLSNCRGWGIIKKATKVFIIDFE